MNANRPLIEMKNIDISFGSFQALKDVSVDFDSGELVGLVGDNGAGKTTLIRILCGMYEPTGGQVFFDGQKIKRFNPRLTIDLGIETIQQTVGLCSNLSIARNFYLGREPVKRRFGIPFLDFDKMRKKSESVIREFGLRENVSPDDEVEILSGGERQSVKIGHAVEFKNRVIIMDEPTNHLSVREREHVNNLLFVAISKGVWANSYNLASVLQVTATLGIMALGEALVITSGEIDISAGSTFGFSAITYLGLVLHVGPILATIIALAAGIGIGVLNGFMVVWFRIPSLIMTLGSLLIF
jgi:simple sugar transport system ATP-binding protein